jgi:threonine dehydrogenase-like Zn-dependent dehydrogenase
VIATCVKSSALYGKVVLLGTPRAALEGNLTDVLRPVHMRGLQVLGAFEWRLPPYNGVGITHSIQSNLALLWNWIEEGRLNVDALISHVVKPQAMQAAYLGLKNDRDNYLGVLVDWRD